MNPMLHIPDSEKKQPWYLLLESLVNARLARPEPEKSKLIRVLNGESNYRNWADIKKTIEIALKYCTNGSSILAKTSQIKGSHNPDEVIDEMFAELRSIPYLLIKGAQSIIYCKTEVDFKVEFSGAAIGVEVTYLNGPDFKFQTPVFQSRIISQPVYKLSSKELISKLSNKYSKKAKQLVKHGYNHSNSIILIITDMQDVYEPWLLHDKDSGTHPIHDFVLNTKFPLVIYGPTLYEPDNGIFANLNHFDWSKLSTF